MYFFLRIFMKFEAKKLSPAAFHALTCVEVSASIQIDRSKMAADVLPLARFDEYAKPCEPSIHVLRSVDIMCLYVDFSDCSFKFKHQGTVSRYYSAPGSPLTECCHFGEYLLSLESCRQKNTEMKAVENFDQYFKNHLIHSNLNAIFAFLRKFPLYRFF